MLQVADEVDDAVGALRLFAMGWSEDIGLTVASGAAACAVCAALSERFARLKHARRKIHYDAGHGIHEFTNSRVSWHASC